MEIHNPISFTLIENVHFHDSMAKAIPFGEVGIYLQIMNGICRSQYPFVDPKYCGLDLKLESSP